MRPLPTMFHVLPCCFVTSVQALNPTVPFCQRAIMGRSVKGIGGRRLLCGSERPLSAALTIPAHKHDMDRLELVVIKDW
uniref:Putative secreted peptide n=1 Tax=Anopheles braziliensis TaxID=58242 RepID=A0A2M3ZW26_9DIPT